MKLTLAPVWLMMALNSSAWAGTACDNFPGAIFCDDFDTYCSNPLGAPCSPQCPRGSKYSQCPPGVPEPEPVGNESPMRGLYPRTSMNYHLSPMDTCGGTFTLEGDTKILTSAPYGGRIYNGGDENGDLGQSTVDLRSRIHTRCGPEWDAVTGTDLLPLVLEFDMGSGVQSAAGLFLSDGYVELSLEELDPSKQRYLDLEVTPTDYIQVGGEETPGGCSSCFGQCALAPYNATDGRAPHAAWPTICQSYDARTTTALCPDPSNPDGPDIPCNYPPPYCPPVPTTKMHKTLAIGALAMLDPDPCHCENPVKPEPCPGKPPIPEYYNHTTMNHHLAYFDGWKWRSLRAGHYGDGATGSGDFFLGSKADHVKITIKTSTVKIEHWSRRWIKGPDPCSPDSAGSLAPTEYSVADNIPRQYLGGFNALRIGNAPGCQLCSSTDTDTRCQQINSNGAYDCQIWAGTRCHNQGSHDTCSGPYVDDGSNFVSLDQVVLTSGSCDATSGACCSRTDGSCTITTQQGCQASNGAYAGGGTVCEASTCTGACCQPSRVCTDTPVNQCSGLFQGPNTNCATRACPCHTPNADFDEDGDVDQDDFGAFQRCYTGTIGSIVAGCECFNRNGDNTVDDADFTAFKNCMTGPKIPLNPLSPPAGCVP